VGSRPSSTPPGFSILGRSCPHPKPARAKPARERDQDVTH
jgi:hypothetical protein